MWGLTVVGKQRCTASGVLRAEVPPAWRRGRDSSASGVRSLFFPKPLLFKSSVAVNAVNLYDLFTSPFSRTRNQLRLHTIAICEKDCHL